MRITSLRRLSIKSQLLILLLFVGLSGVALVTFVALRSAKSVREQTLFSQLTSVRTAKATRIRGYFGRIRAHLDTLGETYPRKPFASPHRRSRQLGHGHVDTGVALDQRLRLFFMGGVGSAKTTVVNSCLHAMRDIAGLIRS